ncbi:MAG: zinc-ribbon domain containing protein [Candidatus Melainabacteria bacterium]|nr:zinc-ribbon domain containing protein [Candidatus Melainabacteria bacterium]
MFEDKTLSCKDCQQAFTFTAGEQEFYAAKKLTNEPKRCLDCRTASRIRRDGGDPDKHSTQVPCHQCGTIARVPFRPTGEKPVYCPRCFHLQKTQN